MNAEQKELLKNILENKEFLAEILKSVTENTKVKVGNLNIGDTIVIADITWRKFKEDEKGNSYFLADDTIMELEFGETNDWRVSPIRVELAKLAEKIEKEIDGKLVPITTDLFSHDGLDNYGNCEDLVSLLTFDMYRNNRKNIQKFDSWWWLATPDSTPSGRGSDDVQYVISGGNVGYDLYDSCIAVRPSFVLNSSIFES